MALTYECVMVESVFTLGTASLQHCVWQPPYSHTKAVSPDLGFLVVCTFFFQFLTVKCFMTWGS